MKPIISIVTNDEKSSTQYYFQLEAVFNKTITIETYNNSNNLDSIGGSLILTSTEELSEALKILKKDIPIVKADLTYSNDSVEFIKSLSYEEPILFVNYDKEMTEQSIKDLKKIFKSRYNFVPYYPGIGKYDICKLAITPNEKNIVPDECKEVIDIGHRILSIKTLLEINIELHMRELISDENFNRIFINIFNQYDYYKSYLIDSSYLEKQLSLLINNNAIGIIKYNSDFVMDYINDYAKSILGFSDNVIKKDIKISYFFGGIDLKNITDCLQISKQINNTWIDITIYQIKYVNHSEYLLMFKKAKKEKILVKHVSFDSIIGHSKILQESVLYAMRASKSESPILLTGESGTGKGIFAKSIHNFSRNYQGSFVSINASSIPENLIESELFGYEKGAFTGARKEGKKGVFELADKGTIFLDEIDSMSVSLQSKILKVIEDKTFRRVGGDLEIHTDFRVISATNKHLWDLVKIGMFREDLYYRLAVFCINIPPLRERGNDIIYLIDYYLKENNLDVNFTDGAKSMIKNYSWPGNIRQLRNFIERLTIFNNITINEEMLKNKILFYDMKFDKNNYCINNKEYDMQIIKIILEILKQNKMTGEKTGFNKLYSRIIEGKFAIKSNKVKSLLKNLSEKEYVKISVGRGGTEITDKGVEYLQTLK